MCGVHRVEVETQQYRRALEDQNTAADLADLRATLSATVTTGAGIRASRHRHEEAVQSFGMKARPAEQKLERVAPEGK